MKFYTYAHLKADTGEIFYIGKGSGNRYRMGWSKSGHRSDYWKRTVDKHGFKPIILAKWNEESEAFAHEKLLIESMRDIGVKLVNLCDGGGGANGAKRSPEICEMIGSRYRGKRLSEEHCKNIATAKTGSKQSAETVAKRISKVTGKKRSDQAKANYSNAARRRTPEQITKAAQARSAAGYPKEYRDAIAERNSKPFTCNETGVTFPSGPKALEWIRAQGYESPSVGNIAACIKGKKRTAYGYTWSRHQTEAEMAVKVKQGSGI